MAPAGRRRSGRGCREALNAGIYDTGHIAASTQIQMTTGGTNNPSGWGSVGVWPVKIQ